MLAHRRYVGRERILVVQSERAHCVERGELFLPLFRLKVLQTEENGVLPWLWLVVGLHA